MSDAISILSQIKQGDPRVLPFVYDELKKLAADFT
jgi:hypothetical protein